MMMPLAGQLNFMLTTSTLTTKKEPTTGFGDGFLRRHLQSVSEQICAICKEKAVRWSTMDRSASFRGRKFIVCSKCKRIYHDPVGQIEQFGFRFRFVRKQEIAVGPSHRWGQAN